MLTGATNAFKENGCQLSGGHTTEGELALGFAVEGEGANLASLWTKGGMKKDHVLILTKPIGSGIGAQTIGWLTPSPVLVGGTFFYNDVHIAEISGSFNAFYNARLVTNNM